MKKKNKHSAKGLNFGFARRRINKDKVGEPICPDYRKGDIGSACELSGKCKNATYLGTYSGTCYGGTKSSEVEYRKKYPVMAGVK